MRNEASILPQGAFSVTTLKNGKNVKYDVSNSYFTRASYVVGHSSYIGGSQSGSCRLSLSIC